MINQYKGDYDTALKYYLQSLEILKRIGDVAGEALSIGQIGVLYTQTGKFKEALENLIQVYEVLKRLGSPNKNIAIGQIVQLSQKMDEAEFAETLQKSGLSLEELK